MASVWSTGTLPKRAGILHGSFRCSQFQAEARVTSAAGECYPPEGGVCGPKRPFDGVLLLMATFYPARRRLSLLGLIAALVLAGACSRHQPGQPATAASTSVGVTDQTGVQIAASASPISLTASPSEVAAIGDQQWAQQALQILNIVDAATADYHNATRYDPYTLDYQQLQQQAFAGFNQALAENGALWPATQRVKDASIRDQFIFVMGNIGGFMHPTPDLPGDPAGPTLGDRIARSLQNAVSTSAAVRPKLQRLASGG